MGCALFGRPRGVQMSSAQSISDSLRRSTSSTSTASASTNEEEQSLGEFSSHESSSRSLSEVLKYPKPSVLARKRRVHCKPPVGVKRCRGQTVHNPKISLSNRVKQ